MRSDRSRRRLLIGSPRPRAAVVLAILISGCAEESFAEGSFRVSIDGDDFIEQGIPASEFEDGWQVEFSRFIVRVDGVSAGDTELLAGGHLFELAVDTGGEGQPVSTTDVAGGRYERLDYVIAPGAAAPGAVPSGVADAMEASGASIWVVGTGRRGTDAISFDWRFSTSTAYAPCAIDVVVDGNEAHAEITIHSEHLFYDSLGAGAAGLRFDAIAAADVTGDGNVAADELWAVHMADLPDYDTGGQDVTTLWEFIVAQTATLGRVDGDGECGG